MTQQAPRHGNPDEVLFSAVLRPHRSGNLKSVHYFMIFLFVILFPPATIFLLSGAWPVAGFMGLEALGLYIAFRLNLLRARSRETVDVTYRALTVNKIDHWGRTRTWTFQPQWLSVVMDDPPRHESKLMLKLRERSLVIGAFLTPAERLEVAGALREAVARAKTPVYSPA